MATTERKPRASRGKNLERRQVASAIGLLVADDDAPEGAIEGEVIEGGTALALSGEGTTPLQSSFTRLLRPEQLGARPVVGLAREQWMELFKVVERANRSAPWILADLLLYGSDNYGEDYAQVLADDVWSYQTQKNLITTARAVPIERRRIELTISHHAEVASLEPEVQDRLLDKATENGWTREQMREAVRTYKREVVRLQALSAPVPEGSLSASIFVEQGDATRMALGNETVDCIFTSVPYGLDKGEDDDAASWPDKMNGFIDEALRVLRPHGRLIVNLPIDTTLGGYRPLAANFTTWVLNRPEFRYVTTITWNEGNVSKSIARGSVDSPAAPRIINPAEAILVFSKGSYGREAQGLTTDLTHEEWLEWTNGMWVFPGESNPWEGFAAGAFPEELPRRVLKLFTFREDRILDPFVGSGTTLAAGWRLGRSVLGYDRDQARVDSCKRRIAVLVRGEDEGTEKKIRRATPKNKDRGVEAAEEAAEPKKARRSRSRKADVEAVIEEQATDPANVVIKAEPDPGTEPIDLGDVDAETALAEARAYALTPEGQAEVARYADELGSDTAWVNSDSVSYEEYQRMTSGSSTYADDGTDHVPGETESA